MHEDYRVVDFWIQGQKTIKSSLRGLVLMTSGAKTRKSWHNITSKDIGYRIIVHWVICSWVVRLLLTEPAGDPRKNVSTQKCFHYNSSAVAVTSHTLFLHAESVLPEV